MKTFSTIRLAALFVALFIASHIGYSQKVVLQAFWWDYHNNNYANGWSNYLVELAPRLKAMGVDAIWIPPSIKNGNQGVGYSPFDHYDLGDKYQKGFLKTRMGSKDELLRLIAVMHANGIEVIQDIVLNHVDNAGSATGAGGQDPAAWDDGTTQRYKNFRYVSYTSPASAETAANYLSRSGRFSKNWQNFYPNPANSSTTGDWNSVYWGPDIAYDAGSFGQSSNATFNPTQSTNHMRNGTRDWLVWYKKQVGFDGVRIDAVKHFPHWAMEDFLWNMQFNAGFASGGNGMLSVGEFVGGKSDLDAWTNNVQKRAGTFDFSLRQGIYNMISGGGNFDIGSIPTYQQGERVVYYSDINKFVHRTVPFVNNHDTFRPQLNSSGNYIGWNTSSELAPHIDPFDGRLSVAYAIAMAVDGSPQIFFEDLFNVANGKRFTHVPTNTTDLPVRSDLVNLIWCHQNLRFKDGAYKVRYQSQDHLVIERSTRAVIGINDSWNNWQNHSVQTDFAQGTVLKDYSGANGTATVTVGAGGWVNINTPPCNGTANQGRRGYSVWAPTNATTNFTLNEKTTTQEWELADDLGDNHASSLQQGGALPASSTAERYAGRVFVQSGKVLSYVLTPSNSTQNLTIILKNNSNTVLTSKAGTGTVTGTYTPNFTGWVKLYARNSSTANPSQRVWVRATYTAPTTLSTAGTMAFQEEENQPTTTQARLEEPTFNFENALSVYPNPTTAQNINATFISQEESLVHLKIVDMLGREVHNQKVQLYKGTNDIKISLAPETAQGIYLISVPELRMQQRVVIK